MGIAAAGGGGDVGGGGEEPGLTSLEFSAAKTCKEKAHNHPITTALESIETHKIPLVAASDDDERKCPDGFFIDCKPA